MLVSFECIVVVDEREATHPVAATRIYCEREGRELCFFFVNCFQRQKREETKKRKNDTRKEIEDFLKRERIE